MQCICSDLDFDSFFWRIHHAVSSTNLQSIIIFFLCRVGPRHEVKSTPPPRGQETRTTTSQRTFDLPCSCITDTRHHITSSPTNCYGFQSQWILQVSLLFGLFWFTGGSELCTYLLPTPTSRVANFITLAFLGETQKSLLLRMWPRILDAGCTGSGPNSQRSLFRDPLLSLSQHYYAKHCFECSDCGREFTTANGRDMVRPFRWSPAWVLTVSFSALRRGPSLDRVLRV